MPKNLANEDVNYGQIIFQWVVKEYEKHERGKKWYIIAGLLAAALLVCAVLTGNYLFTLIIALAFIILFLQDLQQPIEVPFAIAETGIIVGNKFYSFSDFTNFWLIYNPPEVKNIYFLSNNLIKHRLQIPLMDNDPRPIRDYLAKFIKEDLEQEEEPLSDRLGRVLKLH
jgi:hypothetical protein